MRPSQAAPPTFSLERTQRRSTAALLTAEFSWRCGRTTIATAAEQRQQPDGPSAALLLSGPHGRLDSDDADPALRGKQAPHRPRPTTASALRERPLGPAAHDRFAPRAGRLRTIALATKHKPINGGVSPLLSPRSERGRSLVLCAKLGTSALEVAQDGFPSRSCEAITAGEHSPSRPLLCAIRSGGRRAARWQQSLKPGGQAGCVGYGALWASTWR